MYKIKVLRAFSSIFEHCRALSSVYEHFFWFCPILGHKRGKKCHKTTLMQSSKMHHQWQGKALRLSKKQLWLRSPHTYVDSSMR